jgi:hypothetical protein
VILRGIEFKLKFTSQNNFLFSPPPPERLLPPSGQAVDLKFPFLLKFFLKKYKYGGRGHWHEPRRGGGIFPEGQ